MNNVDDSVAKELLEVQRTLGWMDLVIGSIDDAVYVTDEYSRIVFANQYFSDLLNIPRIFLLGHAIDDIFDVKLDAKLTAELTYAGSHDAQDAAIYHWESAAKRLTFKISKRHIATTKQQVYLAKDITREQQLSNMKNSFINLASHQLRTPMTSIMLHSHMLKELHEHDEQHSRPRMIAEAISRSADRMIRLINDILNITRIQNESLYQASLETTDLSGVIDIIHDDVRDQLIKKDLSFLVNVSESLPAFKCDRSAVHEILSNLVTNAVQYTPPSGKITVSAVIRKAFVVITVKDTGIGIPSEALSRIYDQFSRADNAFETFNEGTGLGLYLVKLLLMKIDGTIECKSAVNVGTTFTVKIPYVP